MTLYKENKGKWEEISKILNSAKISKNRTGKQCR